MTATLEIPWDYLVRKADPDFDKARRREREYEFTDKIFHANPAERGVYRITGYEFSADFADDFANFATMNRRENGF